VTPVAETFRVAHISDLHLTRGERDWRSEPRLYGRLQGMNSTFRRLILAPQVQGADLVLVTGDVTDRGEEGVWELFWQELDKAGLTARCRVIPGNHDVCCLSLRGARPRRARAAGDLARVRKGLALRRQEASFPWVERFWGGRVALFGLDSSNSGNLSAATNAQGALGFVQLEKLARLLRATADAPVKLVALHHSPNIPGDEVAGQHGVERMTRLTRWGHEIPPWERRALRLLCLLSGVRAILHGHLHRSEDRRVNGVRIVGAPASTEPREGAVELRALTVSAASLRVTTAVHRVATGPAA
jgi:3',5'-cyclic AMP phosphodiesterase CpdA